MSHQRHQHIRIIEATWDDLPEVARVHVQSWQEAYAGLLPQDYLDNLSVEARLHRWRESFQHPKTTATALATTTGNATAESLPVRSASATNADTIATPLSLAPAPSTNPRPTPMRSTVLLARAECEPGAPITGFISYGPARDTRKNGWGEIWAIYLLRQYWSQGAGYALFTEVRRRFATQPEGAPPGIYLWVLNTNAPAIHAYQRWGGTLHPGQTLHATMANQPVTEVMVTFEIG